MLDEERDGHRPWRRRPEVGRRAPPGGHRRGGGRTPHGARAAAPRPGRHGAGPPELRVRLLRGQRALRGAPREAARGGRQELLRPDVRGHDQPRPRAAGADARCLRRPQPHDGAARGGRGPRSRPSSRSWSDSGTSSPATPDPRRAPRAARGPDGGGPGHVDSMSPEQRAQLQALAESLFEDMDLRWQVDRLAENLRKAVPGAGWGQRYRFSGDEPMGLAGATDAAGPAGGDGPARAVPALGHLARRAGRGRPGQGGQVTWARTGPGPSTAWPGWPSSWRRPASSSSARAATS